MQQDLVALSERLAHAVDLAHREPLFEDGRFYGGPTSELLPTARLMNERITATIAAATEELCTVQTTAPTDRSPEVLHRGFARDRELLERGGRVRYLYSGAYLEDPQTFEYVSEFLRAGGEVRVGVRVPRRQVLVDRRNWFVDVTSPETPHSPDAGWHIRDVAPVSWAVDNFSQAWGAALPWSEARARVAGAMSTARQRQILRALEEGLSQQRVADRVHISDRVVNRDLSSLRQALGMTTTTQVLIWWGGTEERLLP
ncbi:hypothetical protein HHL19_36495 [Streptomyces sp. R302]|uniref:LuxR C-terminal-related transcriptional regulator n=1 Tax=unclassified Streptomyces TaxID=2593676 RepID=UPI00145C3FB6|nr:hypothetical protein [Streptomyces sp. R301]NML84012.1 hypothetical protein [Streptomyces sp. R302]